MISRYFPLFYDYYYLWSAGALCLSHQNPYDLEQLEGVMRSVGWPYEEGTMALSHPPLNLWLYVLFALFPFETSAVVWAVCTGAMIAVSGLLLAKLFPSAGNRQQRYPEVIFLSFLFPSSLTNIFLGQVNALVLLGMVGAWYFLEARKPKAAGALLAFSLLKPHLLFPIYVFLGVRALKQKQPVFLLYAFLGGLTQVGLSLYLNPLSLSWYLDAIRSEGPAYMHLVGSAPAQILDYLAGIPVFRVLLPLGGIAVGLSLAVRNFELRDAMLLLLPISLITTPHVWHHSMVLLLPAAFFVVQHCEKSPPTWKLKGFFFLFAILSIAAFQPKAAIFFSLFPILMGVLIVLLRRVVETKPLSLTA